MEDHTDLIEALVGRIENYVKTNIELAKLRFALGGTSVMASLITNLALVAIASVFLVFVNIGIALWLGELLGKVYYGFFIIAGLYALGGLVIYFFLPNWLHKPIAAINAKAFNLPVLMKESELEEAIVTLENKQVTEGEAVREHLHRTFESLKPVNLVRNAVHSVVTSPEIKNDVITIGTGLAAGFVTNKIVTGNSKNPLRNLAGKMLEIGVVEMVARHPKEVKASFALLKLLFRNKPAKETKARRNQL